MEGLQYKENLSIISGGYSGEEIGSDGLIQDWTNASSVSGSNTVKYHYRDSRNADNNNSSRVVITITDSWNATKNSDRSISVTVNSVINSIVRDDIRGTPGNISKNITIRRSSGSAVIWSVSGDNSGNAHTIATNINLGSTTFTLPPNGGATEQSAIYYRSVTAGYDNVPVPNEYTDEIWIGTNFRNILPPDYRPMKILDANGVWQSCNRNGGKCHIRTASGTLKELRTDSGPSGTGNSPYIYHSDGVWHNQRLIGENA